MRGEVTGDGEDILRRNRIHEAATLGRGVLRAAHTEVVVMALEETA